MAVSVAITPFENRVEITPPSWTTTDWKTVDLSSEIPSGATGAIIEVEFHDDDAMSLYWRVGGSSDTSTPEERRVRVEHATLPAVTVAFVKVDGSRQFDCKKTSGSNEVRVFLRAYFGQDVVLWDDPKSYDVTASDTWETKDVTADVDVADRGGVEAFLLSWATGSIKGGTVTNGFRAFGDDHTAEMTLVQNCTAYWIVKSDSSDRFEARTNVTANNTLYVAGYVPTGHGLTMISSPNDEAFTVTKNGLVLQADMEGHVPVGATAVIIGWKTQHTGTERCGLQHPDSTDQVFGYYGSWQFFFRLFDDDTWEIDYQCAGLALETTPEVWGYIEEPQAKTGVTTSVATTTAAPGATPVPDPATLTATAAVVATVGPDPTGAVEAATVAATAAVVATAAPGPTAVGDAATLVAAAAAATTVGPGATPVADAATLTATVAVATTVGPDPAAVSDPASLTADPGVATTAAPDAQAVVDAATLTATAAVATSTAPAATAAVDPALLTATAAVATSTAPGATAAAEAATVPVTAAVATSAAPGAVGAPEAATLTAAAAVATSTAPDATGVVESSAVIATPAAAAATTVAPDVAGVVTAAPVFASAVAAVIEAVTPTVWAFQVETNEGVALSGLRVGQIGFDPAPTVGSTSLSDVALSSVSADDVSVGTVTLNDVAVGNIAMANIELAS